MDWSKYPSFSENEFRCKHTKLCAMRPEFMAILQDIRNEYKKPLLISSGYRHPTHPIEAAKQTPGEHSLGTCADVLVSGPDAIFLLKIALRFGITRVGVQQKGPSRFLHLGIGGGGLPSPMIWSY